jgi:hypothetical protein
MVALSGTLSVVYQIRMAEHDIFVFSKGDTCISHEELLISFSTLSSLISSWILYSISWTDGIAGQNMDEWGWASMLM